MYYGLICWYLLKYYYSPDIFCFCEIHEINPENVYFCQSRDNANNNPPLCISMTTLGSQMLCVTFNSWLSHDHGRQSYLKDSPDILLLMIERWALSILLMITKYDRTLDWLPPWWWCDHYHDGRSCPMTSTRSRGHIRWSCSLDLTGSVQDSLSDHHCYLIHSKSLSYSFAFFPSFMCELNDHFKNLVLMVELMVSMKIFDTCMFYILSTAWSHYYIYSISGSLVLCFIYCLQPGVTTT